METEVDIVEFKVPVENNKTLFVWNILPTFSEAYIYDRICKHFSVFGALFSVRVRANASVAEPGFYAIVKFFSAAQACWAQEATDERGLFQDKPLKVRLCTRQNPAFCQTVRCLSSAKCQELANYYLGFNGWSSRVVTLNDISITDNAGPLPLGTETQAVSLKYGCIVELMFTKHGVSCRGVGVAEELLENNPGMFLLYTI
ncbi:RDM1 protein, partial [Atractosteus spatula]|nr:RDM1 protein [Atractosteus spatula]